jgi:hypothetical protein
MSHDSFFGLSVYGLELHFTGGGQVHGLAGAHWRGLMGGVLHRFVCSYPTPVCMPCPKSSTCTYTNLFKPTQDAVLSPFWLHGWQRVSKGWIVTIRWIGNNNAYAVGEWLDALANAGGGYSIGGQVVRLEHAVSAASGNLVWSKKQGWHTSPVPIALTVSTPVPKKSHVEFLTPLISKHSGNPLFGALHTRIQRLVLQYGDGREIPRPEQPWSLRVVAQQEQRIALSKRVLTGSLWYLELSEIKDAAWELLNAGLELHAGGQTSMGCGHFKVS